MPAATESGSRWRCFPVGLRPPSKHLHRERTCTNIIKQYVNEQTYFKSIFMPYGTKVGEEESPFGGFRGSQGINTVRYKLNEFIYIFLDNHF